MSVRSFITKYLWFEHWVCISVLRYIRCRGCVLLVSFLNSPLPFLGLVYSRFDINHLEPSLEISVCGFCIILFDSKFTGLPCTFAGLFWNPVFVIWTLCVCPLMMPGLISSKVVCVSVLCYCVMQESHCFSTVVQLISHLVIWNLCAIGGGDMICIRFGRVTDFDWYF